MKYIMMIISTVCILVIGLQANANKCKDDSINNVSKQILLKLLEQQASETKTIKLVVG